jgi:spore coat protein U-like protein
MAGTMTMRATHENALAAAAAIMAQSLLVGPAFAATATGNLMVRITIQAECKIQSAADLDFGTRGVIANIDQGPG